MSADNKVVPFQQPKKNATVLIVDDEDGVRHLLTLWITSLGYTAKAVGDAAAALDALKSAHVSVAVCDIVMPGQDGVWLIDQLRRDYPKTAVVIATGLADMTPNITLQAGVAGYLIKPFQRQELATVLHNALIPNSPWVRHLGRQLPDDQALTEI